MTNIFQLVCHEASVQAINQHVATLPPRERQGAVVQQALRLAMHEYEQKMAAEKPGWLKRNLKSVLGGLALIAGGTGAYLYMRDRASKSNVAPPPAAPPPTALELTQRAQAEAAAAAHNNYVSGMRPADQSAGEPAGTLIEPVSGRPVTAARAQELIDNDTLRRQTQLQTPQ